MLPIEKQLRAIVELERMMHPEDTDEQLVARIVNENPSFGYNAFLDVAYSGNADWHKALTDYVMRVKSTNPELWSMWASRASKNLVIGEDELGEDGRDDG